MKICMIIDRWNPYWGGGQVHVLELAKILSQEYGDQVHIYTRKLKKDGIVYDCEESIDDKIKIFRVGPVGSFENTFTRFVSLITMTVAVLKGDRVYSYDIFHGHSYLAALPLKIASIITKKKAIFTAHSMVFSDGGNMISAAIENILLSKIKFDAEIAVSKKIIDKFNNVNKVHYIPNGVDISLYDSLKNGKKEVFNFIFAGRIVKEKGLQYLVDAASILKEEECGNFKIRIMGDGELREELENYIRNKNVVELFDFLGEKQGESLINEYLAANALVLPSLSEGFSLTLLEAMAAKLPIIATNVGMNKEVVVDGKTGFIVPPGDAIMIARQMRKMMEMKNSQLQSMGEAGYTICKKSYTWKNIASATRQIYKNL